MMPNPTPVSTPAERLQANRLAIRQVVQAGLCPELHKAEHAARQLVGRHPVAAVVLLAVGGMLVMRMKPWRWWLPTGAIKVALARLAWRAAENMIRANLARTPAPARGPQPASPAKVK